MTRQLKVVDLINERKTRLARLQQELYALETLGGDMSDTEFDRIESNILARGDGHE